jgi:MFS family permease
MADKFEARKVVMTTQGAAMAISIALAVVTLTDTATLPVVYLLAALGGVALAFDAPGRQSLTFQMVGPRELPNAVALNAGLFNGSRVIGPAIAGIVIAAVGTGLCFVLNAASFLAVLTAILLLRDDEFHPVEKDREATVVDGLRQAFSHAWHNPQLRLILGVVTVVSTIGFNFHVLVPLLAADTLHVGPEGFGFLSAAFGLGALAGALAAATFRRASWRLFAIGTASFGVFALLLAPVQNAYLAGILLVGIGVSFTLFTANANALVQLASPDQLRGRLVGIYLFAFVGVAPVGGLLAGWLAEIGGTTLAFSVAGTTALVAIAYAQRQRWHAAEPLLDTR